MVDNMVDIACADDMRERRHTFRVLSRDLLSRPPNIETIDVILHQKQGRGSEFLLSNRTQLIFRKVSSLLKKITKLRSPVAYLQRTGSRKHSVPLLCARLLPCHKFTSQ
jgi:hypothetical protein